MGMNDYDQLPRSWNWAITVIPVVVLKLIYAAVIVSIAYLFARVAC